MAAPTGRIATRQPCPGTGSHLAQDCYTSIPLASKCATVSDSERLLIVEDDLIVRLSLGEIFTAAGYTVQVASNGSVALDLLARAQGSGQSFAVVLTDIDLGDVDGITVLKAARAAPFRPEVILITGYGSVQTAISALRAGAFDYLLKPCDPGDLLAVVARAVAHREAEQTRSEVMETITVGLLKLQSLDTMVREPVPALPAAPAPADGRYLRIGKLQIDRFTHTVTLDGRPLQLTPTEYALLICLAETPSRVREYADLMQQVYGYSADDRQSRALLKGHIHNLRAKTGPELINAVRGIGYILVPPEE